MDLYERFLSKENFELAYSRLKHAPNNEYKFFYEKDSDVFGFLLGNNIEQLINEIKSNKYKPQKVCRYYVPKKNYLTRPISLLNFVDLLVYQAIANVLMDEVQDDFSVSDNRVVFANTINNGESGKYFQFNNWRVLWKGYKKTIENNFNEGYCWVADFDIASFYDLIDQEILLNQIKDRGIDENILELLKKCLRQWTLSTDDKSETNKRCGIPQGPECSGFFAEIYLRQIDSRILRNLKDIKYFRYADDIKIMAKTEQACQKAVALLDYYCKDICLIAQSGKIGIKHLDGKSVYQYINCSGLKLSNITAEYKREGEIKESTHNKLKKKLHKVFDEKEDLYLDKTLLKFSFFKLNKDDEIRDLILSNWDKLYLTFEGSIYYLNKYYSTDERVLNKIKEVLLSDDVLFQYNKAVIFDKFKELPFYEDVYEVLTKNKNDRFWIVKYFAVKWLKRLNQSELIKFILSYENNYFIEREVLLLDITTADSEIAKKQIAKQYYIKDTMLALSAFYLYQIYDLSEDTASDYILNILRLDRSDYIRSYLKEKYGINKGDTKKFINLIGKDSPTYHAAVNALIKFDEEQKGGYPSNALMSLDIFHNIIADQIYDFKADFGVKIEKMEIELPNAGRTFKMIHDARNQRTSAHYKDKNLKVRKEINGAELKTLLAKAKLNDAYIEIFDYINKK